MTERPRGRTRTFVAAVVAVATVTGMATALPASTTALAATLRAGGAATAAGTWRVQPSPGITQPTGALASVSCATARACTGVGSYVNPAGLFVTLAEAWNGTSWRKQPTPNPAGGSNLHLTGASCVSPGSCEAVGSYLVRNGAARVGLAERWNGRTWTLQSLPIPAGSSDVSRPPSRAPRPPSVSSSGST